MNQSNVSFYNQNDYDKDIVWLAKRCILVYLRRLEQEGCERSVNQHLFEDTLLHKETVNFLMQEPAPGSENDVLDYESRIMAKADAGFKNGKLYPLEYLCRIFELNPFERFCVTMLAASEINPDFKKVYTYINNDWKRNTLSVGMAVKIYRTIHGEADALYSYLSENSKLLQYFCEIEAECKEYWLDSGLCLKSRMKSVLLEDGLTEDALNKYGSYYAADSEPDPLLLNDKPYIGMYRYITLHKPDRTVLFYLYGIKGIGKKLNIKYLARKMDRAVYFLDLRKLMAASVDFNTLIQMILTEVIMKQAFLCICSGGNSLTDDEAERSFIVNILDRIKEVLPVIFLTSDSTKKAAVLSDRVKIITIGMAARSMEENHRFWLETAKRYPLASDINPDELADKFTFSPGQIKDIFDESVTLAEWDGQDKIDIQLLRKVCFDKIEHNLGRKAQKVNLMYRWEDLILPEYQKNRLKAACDQIKYKYQVYSRWGFDTKMAYGTGLSLIFSGSPGTGKTMAAQVIAAELNLELYKVELASVVSKYIGETERNLNEIFEEARKSQGIIFFDEADVLFSKRSEVKDSNDKYSNMEAAFMLQKIEEYPGIVILATNYQQNIDEAFKRRIKFLIDFPFPDVDFRKKLWSGVFPDKLPLDNDIDINFLASKFELTGSNIRNIAVNAAFLAASEETTVGMSHIIRAVVNEFTKAGKKITKEDLGEYYMFV